MIKEDEKWESPLLHKYAGWLHALIAHAAVLTEHDVVTALHSNIYSI